MNTYIEKNKDRFLSELFDLLRIPSVSADSKYKQDVLKAADFIKDKLMEAGAAKAEICLTKGHPIVYGEKLIDPKAPTVLVYGHYDVQPPDPLNLWTSPPFEPVIKDGRVYARGSCDDKGQMYMHIKALETILKSSELNCNIKFLIEGEEEIGSDNLDTFVKENKDKLKADVVLISDTSIISEDCPSITVGLRGLCYLEVEVTGPKRDLHSGIYGGAVANPINTLCKMIASLKDENNHITIPGFYDDVKELSAKEREELNKIPFDLNYYKKSLTLKILKGRMAILLLKEQVSDQPWMSMEFGEVILGKEQKPFFLRKPLRKFQCA